MQYDRPTADTDAMFPPGHPDAPPRAEAKAPPGMAWGLHPGTGDRVLVYLPPEAEELAQQPLPPQRDVWPPRLLAGGAATGVVIGAIGYAGPGLGQAGHAVEMAGVGVGIACASVGALVMLVKGGMGRPAGQHVNVSVNVTNTALGGSATAKARGRR
jgi:hypothetical protein